MVRVSKGLFNLFMNIAVYNSFCRKPAESSANISSRLCENASFASLFTRQRLVRNILLKGKVDKMNIYTTIFIS